MKIALSLWFEDQLEGAIRRIWSELERQNIPSILYNGKYRPHVTLGLWEVPKIDSLVAELQKTSREISTLKIRFETVGLFPGKEGVVFLAPIATAELLSLHNKISKVADHYGTPVSSYYRPGAWVPHSTVACKIPAPDVVRAAQICLQNSCVPQVGEICALGMIQTPEEIELNRFEFSGMLENN